MDSLYRKLVARGRISVWCVAAVLAGVFAGCGKKGEKAGKSESAANSAAIERPGADKDLEFFSEQYLPAEERLRRRQARLQEAVGAQATPVATEAAETSASDVETTSTP